MICFISTSSFTGGPLAIHQAAAKIRDLGGDAGILYIRSPKPHKAFKFRSNKIVPNLSFLERKKVSKELRSFGFPLDANFSTTDHFIIPEVLPDLAYKLLQLGCTNVSIWWLSVDNFPISQLNTLQNQMLLQKCGHLCQSTYAFDFVKRHGGVNVSMLSDEIDLDVPKNIPATADRKFDFCYLPNKATGADEILEGLSKQFAIKPLKNMSRKQIKETLLDTKIFLDFGHHPGKDRVPREAALCGAIPLLRHEGAARFKEDVPLPKGLLIETKAFFDTTAIAEKVQSIIDNSENYNVALDEYVNGILGESDIFKNELLDIINAS